MLWHYCNVVKTCCDVMWCVAINVVIQTTSQQQGPNKNINFSWVFRLFYHDTRTSQHITNQIGKAIAMSWLYHNCVVIMLQLCRNYITMRHNEISMLRCVTTCVTIRKKFKKPNLIIINRVFSRFYKVLYVSYAKFWAWISCDICIKQFCLDWKIFKKYMFRTRCRTEFTPLAINFPINPLTHAVHITGSSLA